MDTNKSSCHQCEGGFVTVGGYAMVKGYKVDNTGNTTHFGYKSQED